MIVAKRRPISSAPSDWCDIAHREGSPIILWAYQDGRIEHFEHIQNAEIGHGNHWGLVGLIYGRVDIERHVGSIFVPCKLHDITPAMRYQFDRATDRLMQTLTGIKWWVFLPETKPMTFAQFWDQIND